MTLVLPLAYSQDPSLNMSNDVISRKDVPFGVSKTKFYISTPFPPNKGNFGPIFNETFSGFAASVEF